MLNILQSLKGFLKLKLKKIFRPDYKNQYKTSSKYQWYFFWNSSFKDKCFQL